MQLIQTPTSSGWKKGHESDFGEILLFMFIQIENDFWYFFLCVTKMSQALHEINLKRAEKSK